MTLVECQGSARPMLAHRDVTRSIQNMRKRGPQGEDAPKSVEGMITVFTAPRVHVQAWMASKSTMRLAVWSVERGRLVPWETALAIACQFARALKNEKTWDVSKFENGILFEAKLKQANREA